LKEISHDFPKDDQNITEEAPTLDKGKSNEKNCVLILKSHKKCSLLSRVVYIRNIFLQPQHPQIQQITEKTPFKKLILRPQSVLSAKQLTLPQVQLVSGIKIYIQRSCRSHCSI